MLSYEIANQLKDVGFPQDGVKHSSLANIGTWLYGPKGVPGDDEAYLPSLSELIKACGGDYFYLSFHNSRWLCKGGEKIIAIVGSTAEEAVANLYLALHEKREG